MEIADIAILVASVTGNEAIVENGNRETPLLGAIPELDSIAIVNLILALEENYGFQVNDDEVEQSLFETLGSLHDFARKKASEL